MVTFIVESKQRRSFIRGIFLVGSDNFNWSSDKRRVDIIDCIVTPSPDSCVEALTSEITIFRNEDHQSGCPGKNGGSDLGR
jgi:hypothetical protein